jgi:hypothetical protein
MRPLRGCSSISATMPGPTVPLNRSSPATVEGRTPTITHSARRPSESRGDPLQREGMANFVAGSLFVRLKI